MYSTILPDSIKITITTALDEVNEAKDVQIHRINQIVF
jgi:hypothetical protein